MSKIIITIEIPDGATVNTNSGRATGKTASSNKPFVERPDPPQPDGYCEIHDADWRLVPAGVSKTVKNADGSPKRYNAFWACPERGCDNKPPFNRDAPAATSAVDELF